MFLHAGWLHLLGNMLFLLVFGNNIEDRFRKIPYLLFYLFAGYVAAYGFAFANQTSVQPLIGASGAIAGVLGAYLVIFPRARVWSLVPFLFFIPVRIPAWLVLGSWFVLQWVYSAGYAASGAGDVAYLAHVFGFLVGLIVGLLVRAASPPPSTRSTRATAEPGRSSARSRLFSRSCRRWPSSGPDRRESRSRPRPARSPPRIFPPPG